MAQRIPARLTAAQGRKFAFTLGIAFAVLAAISTWRGHTRVPIVLAALSGAFLLAGLLFPASLGPVERAWMGMAHAISKVTSPIFLGIVYYLVITPVGAIMRLFGRRVLERDRTAATWWVERPVEARRRVDMERQF